LARWHSESVGRPCSGSSGTSLSLAGGLGGARFGVSGMMRICFSSSRRACSRIAALTRAVPMSAASGSARSPLPLFRRRFGRPKLSNSAQTGPWLAAPGVPPSKTTRSWVVRVASDGFWAFVPGGTDSAGPPRSRCRAAIPGACPRTRPAGCSPWTKPTPPPSAPPSTKGASRPPRWSCNSGSQR